MTGGPASPQADPGSGILKRATPADRGVIALPLLTPHLEFRMVDDGQTILVSETFDTLMHGHIHGDLLPLLDGRRSCEDIVTALADRHSRTDVQTAIASLAARGYAVSGDHRMARGQAAFWSSLGASPRWAKERLAASPGNSTPWA